jgi:hypothetical protein
MGFGIWDLGFGIWDLGFGIWGLSAERLAECGSHPMHKPER